MPPPTKKNKKGKNRVLTMDENTRKMKAITEMTKKLIENYEKNEKINFAKVSEYMLFQGLNLGLDEEDILSEVQAVPSSKNYRYHLSNPGEI